MTSEQGAPKKQRSSGLQNLGAASWLRTRLLAATLGTYFVDRTEICLGFMYLLVPLENYIGCLHKSCDDHWKIWAFETAHQTEPNYPWNMVTSDASTRVSNCGKIQSTLSWRSKGLEIARNSYEGRSVLKGCKSFQNMPKQGWTTPRAESCWLYPMILIYPDDKKRCRTHVFKWWRQCERWNAKQIKKTVNFAGNFAGIYVYVCIYIYIYGKFLVARPTKKNNKQTIHWDGFKNNINRKAL